MYLTPSTLRYATPPTRALVARDVLFVPVVPVPFRMRVRRPLRRGRRADDAKARALGGRRATPGRFPRIDVRDELPGVQLLDERGPLVQHRLRVVAQLPDRLLRREQRRPRRVDERRDLAVRIDEWPARRRPLHRDAIRRHPRDPRRLKKPLPDAIEKSRDQDEPLELLDLRIPG